MSNTMKAIAITEFGDASVLKEIETTRPQPNANEVLIRTVGTSVNYADIQTRRGSFHSSGANLPLIPGLDAAGIIEEVGSEVEGLKKGDRVIAFPGSGSYSEYIVADSNLTFIIPDHLDFIKAAAAPLVSFTSHMLLNKIAGLKEGETVLIHAAAGGIGTTAIQIAKSMGASMIIGTVRSESKKAKALEAGADHVICTDSKDFVDEVYKLTDGNGADIILDSIGGDFTVQNMDCLAMYGRLIVFGNASGSYGNINTKLLHSTGRAVLGFSSVTTRKNRPQWFAETAAKVIPLIADGSIDMKVSHVIGLKDAAKAHELIESGKVTGKIVLKSTY